MQSNKLHDYPHTAGDLNVKKELINYLEEINITNIEEDNLLITASTTHGYTLILKSIIRPHDVIIIPTPTYGLFAYEPEKLGGTSQFIELKEELKWKLDLNELENKIIEINQHLQEKYSNLNYIPRVVAIYNQNPNNPLGVSLGRQETEYLEKFVRLCDKHKVLIIDDLVYRDSVYDEKKTALPLATFNKYKDNIVTLFGISKSYSLAGIRAGFVLGNQFIIQDMRDNIFLQMDSISMLSQIALASVFNSRKNRSNYRKKYLKKIHKKYLYNLDIIKYFIDGRKVISKESRKRIESKLNKNEIIKYGKGLPNITIYHNLIPEAGFFVLIDFTALKGKRIGDKKIKDDIDLIMQLYKKDKIKFLPGCSFAWNNENELIGRITFSKESGILIDNMKSLANIIHEVK